MTLQLIAGLLSNDLTSLFQTVPSVLSNSDKMIFLIETNNNLSSVNYAAE